MVHVSSFTRVTVTYAKERSECGSTDSASEAGGHATATSPTCADDSGRGSPLLLLLLRTGPRREDGCGGARQAGAGFAPMSSAADSGADAGPSTPPSQSSGSGLGSGGGLTLRSVSGGRSGLRRSARARERERPGCDGGELVVDFSDVAVA